MNQVVFQGVLDFAMKIRWFAKELCIYSAMNEAVCQGVLDSAMNQTVCQGVLDSAMIR
jgi:hypothetical protein